MSTADGEIVAGQVHQPDPVDGVVVDIDFGMAGAIVLVVKEGSDRYYETYELVTVEEEAEVGS